MYLVGQSTGCLSVKGGGAVVGGRWCTSLRIILYYAKGNVYGKKNVALSQQHADRHDQLYNII